MWGTQHENTKNCDNTGQNIQDLQDSNGNNTKPSDTSLDNSSEEPHTRYDDVSVKRLSSLTTI